MDITGALPREVLKAFETVPDLYLLLSPELVILTASDAYLEATLTQREKITGKYLFDVFPDNPATPQAHGVANLKASLEQVLRTRQPHRMSLQQYDVPRPNSMGGGFEEKYWSPLNTPVLDEQGNMQYIIHKVQEVTGPVRQGHQIRALEKQVESLSRQALARLPKQTQEALESRELLLSAFDIAPYALSVLRALYNPEGEIEDFEILMQNDIAYQITGLTPDDLIGKRYSQVFPKTIETGLLDKFSKVVRTGEAADFEQWYDGEGMHHWFRIKANKLGHLLVIATENITERKNAEQQIRQKNQLLEAILNAPNMGVTVYEAVRNGQGDIIDFRFVLLNKATIELWGGRDLTGKRLLEEFPGNAGLMQDYRRVVETGTMNMHEIQYRHEGFNNWFYISESKFGDGLVIKWEDITEKKNAEQELLRMKDLLAERATDKYLALFNNMEQGFCIIEMIFDEAEQPVDYRFVEVNPVFGKQTGLKDALGKTMRELEPAHEESWFRIYGQVAKTGKSIHFENQAAHLSGGTWYEVYAFPFGPARDHQVAVLFNDITERKRGEANLAFLADVTEEFSRLSSADQIMQMVGARIGAYLNVATCNFLDVNESRAEDLQVSYSWRRMDVPDLLQSFQLMDFLNEEFRRASRAGETTVIRNTQTDPRTDARACARYGIGAFVGVPFQRDDEWKYYLSVSDTQPRNWRKDEIKLFQELANRIFPRLERARAEEALRKSEERYRTLFNSIDEAFALCEIVQDENGKAVDYRILELNPAFEKMMGLTVEMAQGKTARQVMPTLEGRWIEAYAKAAFDGEPVRFENRDAGLNRWFSAFVSPIGDKGNGRFALLYADITEQKKAEQQLKDFNALLEQQVSERTSALQESKERFQAAINVSPVVLAILKSICNERQEIVDFHFEWVSKSGEAMAGKDVTGLRLTEQFPYLREIGVFEKFVNTADRGKPTDFEYYYNAEGLDLWVRWKAVRLVDGLFVSVEDITERKKAEEEIVKNLTLLKQSEEVAKTGSWEYDPTTGLFNWSEGMYRLFGLPEGSPVSPETYLDYVIEEDLPIARKIIYQLRESHAPLEETVRLQVNGQILTFRIKAVVLRNEQGHPVKVLGVDLDISEVKRLEEENLQMRLNQQKALLLAILEAQEEERRRISESLHNGVGQILYATKLNLDQLAQLVPKQAVQATEKLLSDAINETRRVSHELVPFVLKDFGLEEAILDLCRKYNGSTLRLNCQVEGLQGPLESYLEIAIYRISQELVNNIVKHARATEATLQLSRRKDRILLQVQDNGKGITKEEALKTKGIGLRTTRDRVKLLNGTLVITTPRTGKGTLVTIRIPVQE